MIRIHWTESGEWKTEFEQWWQSSPWASSPHSRWAQAAWQAAQRGGSLRDWLAKTPGLNDEAIQVATETWEAAKKIV